MNKALITGGAGFIGSHLAEALLRHGWTVQVIDDLSTGNIENLDHLKDNPTFSYVFDTVMDRELMTELVGGADVVFHLAAAVGVQLVVDEAVRTIETNLRTTEIVLDLCAQAMTPVLLTSTSEVYGKLGESEFNEEHDMVLGPTSRARWCYAASKIVNEYLAKAYFKERGLPAVIVRLFNTIGPRQTGRYGMVVPRFVRQALLNEAITVYGDGSQRRSFAWVGDVVEALISLVLLPEARGEVFNVGHPGEISIYDLAVTIKEMTNSRSEIRLIPYSEAYSEGFEDMTHRMPDISKIREAIGFEPSVDLPEMLWQIIADQRERLRGLKA